MYQLIYPKQEYTNSYKQSLDYYKNETFAKDYLFHNLNNEFSWRDFYHTTVKMKYGENGISGTVYWLIHGNEYIGTGVLYDGLNKYTENYGGHIGYIIAPQHRNKGHGKVMLKMLLEECREKGIHTALLTCHEDNIASRKIIEHNGGRLYDRITHTEYPNFISVRRYFVDTGLKIKTILPGAFQPKIKDITYIAGNEISLELEGMYGKSTKAVETYVYYMKNPSKSTVGRITFTSGLSEPIFYCGNIGYRVDKDYRGHHYSAITSKMLYDTMKAQGYSHDVIITVNPDNIPSRKNCEYLGCKLLEIVEIPPYDSLYKTGERHKCRYVMK